MMEPLDAYDLDGINLEQLEALVAEQAVAEALNWNASCGSLRISEGGTPEEPMEMISADELMQSIGASLPNHS